MIFGFTGSQNGMTQPQRQAVYSMLAVGGALHHGDCVGADAQAHVIARQHGLWIVGHPPNRDVKRAFSTFDEVREPRAYIERNHVIVDECELLIATPDGYVEQLRSGTWATIRYARKIGRLRRIIYPDGTVKED